MKKTKRASLLTKAVILAVLVVVSISLLDLRARLSSAEQTRDALQQQVDEQAQYNAELQDDIDNSDRPRCDSGSGKGAARPGRQRRGHFLRHDRLRETHLIGTAWQAHADTI